MPLQGYGNNNKLMKARDSKDEKDVMKVGTMADEVRRRKTS
jgi:hypothetical protein